MEQSLEQKQTLLRQQILEAGFNAEQFMTYMSTTKQDKSLQLQNWTIDQLKKIVDDFKKLVRKDLQMQKSKLNLEANRGSKQMMTSKIMESVIKKNKVYYNQSGLWDYEIHNQQQCRKLDQFFTFKAPPEIDYKSWDVKKTGGIIFGFGAKNQLEITFITNFTSTTVTRKSQDIDWLRQSLCNKFPGSFIPPLESIRAVVPQDKTGIMRHVKQSIFFLNSLLSFDYLVQNKYFHAFITQTDTGKFQNFITRQNAVRLNTDIGSIQTIEGNFSVQISHRVLKFVNKSSNYAQNADQIYRNLQTNIRKIMGDLQTLVKHSHYVANDFAKLHGIHSKMAQDCKIQGINNQQEKMSKIFIYLNNMFTMMGNQKKKNIAMLREFSDQFLKYTHSEWAQFLIHNKKYQNEQNNYLNFKLNLLKKKQRTFTDQSKWQLSDRDRISTKRLNIQQMSKQDVFEIMFPKENKMEQQMRIWQAYINQMYEKSYRILINQQEKLYLRYCNRYCSKMEKFLIEQTQIYNKFHHLFQIPHDRFKMDSDRKKSFS